MNAMTEPLLFKQVLDGVERELVSFATHPSRYRHWSLDVEGDVARLKLDIDEDGVELKAPDGTTRRVGARTVIWAAGVAAASIAGRLAAAAGAETDRAGRVTVEPDLTLAGHPEVIALGDMVRVRSQDGDYQDLPGVAPVAAWPDGVAGSKSAQSRRNSPLPPGAAVAAVASSNGTAAAAVVAA